MDCTNYVVKTKALVSCAVTAQLICRFVFPYAKSRFSHDMAHILEYIYFWYSRRGKIEEKTNTFDFTFYEQLYNKYMNTFANEHIIGGW